MLRKYKYAYKAMNCRIKLKLFVMETVNFWGNIYWRGRPKEQDSGFRRRSRDSPQQGGQGLKVICMAYVTKDKTIEFESVDLCVASDGFGAGC